MQAIKCYLKEEIEPHFIVNYAFPGFSLQLFFMLNGVSVMAAVASVKASKAIYTHIRTHAHT